MRIFVFCFGVLFYATDACPGPAEVPVLFTNSITTSGNTNVFVAGSIPQLGNWDSTRAVKIEINSSGVWRAVIGIPEGTSFEYKFVRRATSPDTVYANSANATGTGPESHRFDTARSARAV